MVQTNLLRFIRAAAEGDRFVSEKPNVDKNDARLSEANVDESVGKVEQFLGGMMRSMGESHFRDPKNGIHLSGPGWGELGVSFYDLDVTLSIQDLSSGMARKICEIDWRRDAAFWSDAMREKDVRGTKTLTFIGGGNESRQTIRFKVHTHLGTWDALQQKLRMTSGLR